jgi:hypothetical protein
MQDGVHAYTAGKNYQYYTILNIKFHPDPDKIGRLWAAKFAGTCPVTGRCYTAGAMMRWTLNVETGEAVVLPQETMAMLDMRCHDGSERPDLAECFATSWRFGGVEQIGFELSSYGHQQIEAVEILHQSGKVSRWQLFDETSRKAAERAIKKSKVIAYQIRFKLSVLAEVRRSKRAADEAAEKEV